MWKRHWTQTGHRQDSHLSWSNLNTHSFKSFEILCLKRGWVENSYVTSCMCESEFMCSKKGVWNQAGGRLGGESSGCESRRTWVQILGPTWNAKCGCRETGGALGSEKPYLSKIGQKTPLSSRHVHSALSLSYTHRMSRTYANLLFQLSGIYTQFCYHFGDTKEYCLFFSVFLLAHAQQASTLTTKPYSQPS